MSDLARPAARPNVRTSTLVIASLLAVTLVAWAVAVEQMRGMDAGTVATASGAAWG